MMSKSLNLGILKVNPSYTTIPPCPPSPNSIQLQNRTKSLKIRYFNDIYCLLLSKRVYLILIFFAVQFAVQMVPQKSVPQKRI